MQIKAKVGYRNAPPKGRALELVDAWTAEHQFVKQVYHELTSKLQATPNSSPIRCEFVGNDALPPIRKSLEDNLLAMVRRLSQAEHKHSLSTGRTGVLEVWADTSQRLLRGSYNQSSAVAPLAIQAAPYMSPYRETAH